MINYLSQLDQNIFLYLNNLGNTHWDWFWLFITEKWTWIPFYGLLIYLLNKKTGGKSTLVVLLFVAGLICFTDQTANLLKAQTARLRPCNLDLEGRFIARCGLHGFPSAHAFSSMALAVFIGAILKPYYKYARKGLLVWALFVAYSRVYVGVHYPGDVTVGLLLGATTGFAFFKIHRFFTHKYLSPQPLSPPFENPSLEKRGNWLFKYQNILLYCLLSVSIILYFRTEFNPQVFILEDTTYEVYYEMSAVLISLLGLVLRTLRSGYSFGGRKEKISDTHQLGETLLTTGIYSLVRHPLYVANFLIGLGIVLWTGNYWFITGFCLLYWAYYDRVIVLKEKALQNKFGHAFIKWSEEIPACFPNFKNVKKPSQKFDWGHVLQSEKNRLFLVFLIYCAFNVSGEMMTQGSNYYYFLITMTILLGFGLLLLRYFKNKTTGLNKS